MTQDEIIQNIVGARYRRISKKGFDDLQTKYPKTDPLLVLEKLKYEILNNQIVNNYSKETKQNQELCTSELLSLVDAEIKRLSETDVEIFQEVKAFFVDKNQLIKYSIGSWILPNVGVGLEIFEVSNSLPKNFLKWLKTEYGINAGDKAIQRHVISNKQRDDFKSLGLPAPQAHWSEEYYKDAMIQIETILASNNDLKGVISDGSWIYNPENYNNAPDGRPFVAFTFFNDKKYLGNTFHIGKATSENEYKIDYQLATENDRRRKYVEEGLLTVEKYGTFIPREEILSNTYSHP